jgi:hypothetical protein
VYFWRIEKLKSKLKASPLAEREVLPYLIAWLLSYLISHNVQPPSKSAPVEAA